MFGGYLFLIIEDYIWQLNSCDLARSLCQRAEALATGTLCCGGTEASGDQGRVLAGNLWGLQSARGGLWGGMLWGVMMVGGRS